MKAFKFINIHFQDQQELLCTLINYINLCTYKVNETYTMMGNLYIVINKGTFEPHKIGYHFSFRP